MKRLPFEGDIEQIGVEYGSDGIPKLRTPHMTVKVNLFSLAAWWRKCKERKHEETGYGWAYECGCSAKAGACSDPYCPVHGMRLMRFKLREKIQS